MAPFGPFWPLRGGRKKKPPENNTKSLPSDIFVLHRRNGFQGLRPFLGCSGGATAYAAGPRYKDTATNAACQF